MNKKINEVIENPDTEFKKLRGVYSNCCNANLMVHKNIPNYGLYCSECKKEVYSYHSNKPNKKNKNGKIN